MLVHDQQALNRPPHPMVLVVALAGPDTIRNAAELSRDPITSQAVRARHSQSLQPQVDRAVLLHLRLLVLERVVCI